MDWGIFDGVVSEYKSQVQSTLDSLAELRETAEGFSTAIQLHEDARDEIAECDRKMSHLLVQREGLFEDWSKASFDNDSLRLVEIDGIKSEIDTKLERLTQERAQAQERIEDTHIDGAGIAAMMDRVNALSGPALENVTRPEYIKPMSGKAGVPALLDKLRNFHRWSVKKEIIDGVREIRELRPWGKYVSRTAVLA